MATGRAYSYIRFSSRAQAEGDSLRRQIERSEAWASAHGYVLDHDTRIEDLGLSGWSGKNIAPDAALGDFLRQVKKGEVPAGSVLVVESLDRISRLPPSVAYILFNDLLRAGVEVVTLDDGKHYKRETMDSLDMLLTSILGFARSNQESEVKSQRLKASWHRRKADARSSNKPTTTLCPGWLRVNAKNEFELIPNRQRILEQIFQDSATGLGQRLIADKLNKAGIEGWGKKPGWQESYIARILQSRAVLGEYQPEKTVDEKREPDGPPIRNYYPQAVPEELFVAAKKGRELRKKGTKGTGRQSERFSNLLRGIAFCNCGGSMLRVQITNRDPHYTCSRKHRKLGCDAKNRPYAGLELVILSELSTVAIQSAIGLKVESQRRELQQKLDVLDHKISTLKEERERWRGSFRGPQAAAAEYAAEQIEALSQEINDASQERERVHEALVHTRDQTTTPETWAQAVRELFTRQRGASENERFELRAKINTELRRAIDKVVFAPDGVGIIVHLQNESTVHLRQISIKSSTTRLRQLADPAGP